MEIELEQKYLAQQALRGVKPDELDSVYKNALDAAKVKDPKQRAAIKELWVLLERSSGSRIPLPEQDLDEHVQDRHAIAAVRWPEIAAMVDKCLDEAGLAPNDLLVAVLNAPCEVGNATVQDGWLSPAALKRLYERGADPKLRPPPDNLTMAYVAAAWGADELLKELVSVKGRVDLLATGPNSMNVLQVLVVRDMLDRDIINSLPGTVKAVLAAADRDGVDLLRPNGKDGNAQDLMEMCLADGAYPPFVGDGPLIPHPEIFETYGILQAYLSRPKPDGTRACVKCCAPKASMMCSRCQKVFYCSQKCQKKQWKFHKTVCKAPATAGDDTKAVVGTSEAK